MGSLKVNGGSLRTVLRLVLLLAALATYLVSPDDVVWRFVKDAPNARLLEHAAFGLAAILLGIALLLKIQASTFGALSFRRITIGNSVQAIGIASLLPLPGFLLFVVGDLGVSLLLEVRQKERTDLQDPSWTGAVAGHIGLCCAFVSMIAFSVVLIDRVADALFATSGIISLFASSRRALRARQSRRR